MNSFRRDSATFTCDGIPIATIVEKLGTPTYVYSAAEIESRFRLIDTAFGSHPHAIHYAMKANSSLALIQLLHRLGSAVDANSGGEIELALRAGFVPQEIIFTGVGKTTDELKLAVQLGVKAINAESEGELQRIAKTAKKQGKIARVALRVNPDIDAKSHPHISTGLRSNKFGIGIHQIMEVCRKVSTRDSLALVGLHVHVGSQILDLNPLKRATKMLVDLAEELRAMGITLEHLDIGGGLGISYDGQDAPSASEYAEGVLEVTKNSGMSLILEPGRAIVGPAGVLVTRVVDVKPQPGGRWFVVVDAGMTELIRPALYDAYHRIEMLSAPFGPEVVCDIVGPVCETSDVVGLNRMMPLPEVGDLLVVRDTGAYGAAMSSNYNRRPMAPEVLVENGGWRVIRRRQRIEDILVCESQ